MQIGKGRTNSQSAQHPIGQQMILDQWVRHSLIESRCHDLSYLPPHFVAPSSGFHFSASPFPSDEHKMAEALGLAASVIAVVDLTAKVAGASIKLVSLWKEIKNVPEALLEKAERLRDFEEFLLETEIQASNSPLPQQA
ncbi:hypothetical protein CSAL01_02696 [Colletotrichum salicis]|uniref:Uncharacterized protein n=1 Tax=Colletotrichum salicis TaxID=1209931 RepID=A0A135UQX3_9PEZI|nr:hypothetical protein CSAL01_02696 [Colletotrichum salicis]